MHSGLGAMVQSCIDEPTECALFRTTQVSSRADVDCMQSKRVRAERPE